MRLLIPWEQFNRKCFSVPRRKVFSLRQSWFSLFSSLGKVLLHDVGSMKVSASFLAVSKKIGTWGPTPWEVTLHGCTQALIPCSLGNSLDLANGDTYSPIFCGILKEYCHSHWFCFQCPFYLSSRWVRTIYILLHISGRQWQAGSG